MTALITIFGPISGNSLFNPFRHLAAASLVNGWIQTDWVYYVGPIAGTALSILVYLPIQIVRNRLRRGSNPLFEQNREI
jgi:glycerol uptake facilitator-like aquaporin